MALWLLIKGFFTGILEGLFFSKPKPLARWAGAAWAAALYAGGVYLWIRFFNHGNLTFSFHDWHDITGPRLTFLQDAINHGVLPLFISNAFPLGGITFRYLSIPDAFISPQALLLRFMSVGMFVLVNQVLMYSLGFLGLLWLRRRFSLSPVAFTLLFLLFNLNGHILAHLAVGHETWGGYFLFPWFVALTFMLLDGDNSWSWVAKMSLLMLAIFLQGSFHQYVWAIIFLGILAITSWKRFLTVYKALLFSVLLAMVRILPPTLLVGKFDNTYLGGYPTVADIWTAMTTIRLPGAYIFGPYMTWPVGTWEYDLYVGLIGAIFLLVFGVYFWARPGRGEKPIYAGLMAPVAGLVFLSIGQTFRLLRLLPVGLFDGERVSARIISIPLVFLIILGVIHFQRWLDNRRMSLPVYTGLVGLLLIEVHDLYQHFVTWEVQSAAVHYPYLLFQPGVWFAINRVDIPYRMTLEWGAVVSGVSLLALLVLVWMEKRHIQVEAIPLPETLGEFRRLTGIPVTGKRSYSAVGEYPSPPRSDEEHPAHHGNNEAVQYMRKKPEDEPGGD